MLILYARAHGGASEDGEALIAEAKAAANRGDVVRAEALLRQAEAYRPGEVLMLRANLAAFLRKDLDTAVQLYRDSMASDPTRWDAPYFLGRALVGAQRWDEAVEALEQAATLAPSQTAVLMELGGAHVSRGTWAGARDAFHLAIALNVHAEQPLVALAKAALRLHEEAEAIQAYRDLSNYQPWQPQRMVELASMLHRADASEPTSKAGASKIARGLPAGRTATAGAEVATACDLHDAATTLQPGMGVPAELAALCDQSSARKEVALSVDPAAIAQAKALGGGECAMIADFPSFVQNAQAEKGQCTLKLSAGRWTLDGARPFAVPSGTTLRILGDGAHSTHLDALSLSRHAIVEGGATLSVVNVSLQNGRALLAGGGSLLLLPGAALHAEGVVFKRNRAVFGSGGAIAVRGARVVLAGVDFERNEASWRGGALSLTSLLPRAAAVVGERDETVTGQASASLDRISWTHNRAAACGPSSDVMLSAGAALSPPLPAASATVLAVDVVETIATSASGWYSGTEAAGLRVSNGTLLALECATEALELLEQKGMERPALALLEAASEADAYAPHPFSFHFNFLYTHGMDAQAASRLEAFQWPAHPSVAISQNILANRSAPTLRQRGQTLNGQVARMREGRPVVVAFTERAQAQDAATRAFVQAAALNPADGNIWRKHRVCASNAAASTAG